MIVEIRKVIYPSVKVASETLGVSKYSIYSALDRGVIDLVGLGHTQSQPIDLGGISFRSMSAASVALGFNRSFVRWAMTGKSKTAMDRLQKAVHRYKERNGMTCPPCNHNCNEGRNCPNGGKK